MDYSVLKIVTEAQPELPELDCYDLAIVGAGISSAYTLIHYIALLEKQAAIRSISLQARRPVKIVVAEKSGEFWTGIPYGSKSGRNALLISPLHEFIPQQGERRDFTDWLSANRDRVFNPQQYNQGELARKWLNTNQSAIDQGLWDDLFIPRHTFGLYLIERLEQLITTATASRLIEFKQVTADVVDVQNIQDLYLVDLAGADHRSFLAKQLVLAIGSPPNFAFEQPQSRQQVDAEICYIENMYEPSVDENIARICKSLQQSDLQSQRQVLMVGSNAGTLDTLYTINNSPTAASLIDKFIILSPNAAFPHRISPGIVALNHTPEHLVALVNSGSFTAKQMLIAIQKDLAAATAQNINISDIHSDISKVTMQALNQLNSAEQKQFVIKYSVEIGKLQRRAGREYLDVVNNLVAQHKLELIKGRFTKYSVLTTGGYSCEYIDSDNGNPQVLDHPIRVIINCAGFQDVTKSSSTLIQNLIRREICIPNDSNRGFIIDKDFKASKNCYIMGPLVAGNIDGDFKVWHAESCQRIIGLSEKLAAVLYCSEPQPAPTAIDMFPVVQAELLVSQV